MTEKQKKPATKTDTIKLEFHSVKLSALRQAMEKRGFTIESELMDYLEKMYEKYVPNQVREFISFSENQ